MHHFLEYSLSFILNYIFVASRPNKLVKLQHSVDENLNAADVALRYILSDLYSFILGGFYCQCFPNDIHW